MVVKCPDKFLHEELTARSPSRSVPVLEPKLHFKQIVLHYLTVSHTQVPTSPDWFAELNTLAVDDLWRVWWLTWPAEHPCDACFHFSSPELPVFVPARFAKIEVVSPIVEVVFRNKQLFLMWTI